MERLCFGLVTGTAVRRGLERSDLVHHVLLVDEVAGRLERVEQLRDVVRPVVEQLVWRLRRGEAHNPSRPARGRTGKVVGRGVGRAVSSRSGELCLLLAASFSRW